jgi:hypothetical protein
MATQNPIEQEGTYPLPEAQLDRFLMHVRVDYPDMETERAILRLNRDEARRDRAASPALSESGQRLRRPARHSRSLHGPRGRGLSGPSGDGDPQARGLFGRSGGWLRFGASPRATIALDRCSRALAWLNGRSFVSPEDIQALAPDVLRHRVLLSYEMEAEGRRPDDFHRGIARARPGALRPRHAIEPPRAKDAKTPMGRTEGVLPELTELIALREQARRLDLAPRGRVLATRTGGHVARFRGRGMEFDESRVYQPGDDPRNMDWRVTARAGRPHVKLFREERERPVWLLVDQGRRCASAPASPSSRSSPRVRPRCSAGPPSIAAIGSAVWSSTRPGIWSAARPRGPRDSCRSSIVWRVRCRLRRHRVVRPGRRLRLARGRRGTPRQAGPPRQPGRRDQRFRRHPARKHAG